jgi:glycosidase
MKMEFHISSQARERYGVDSTLFSYSGNVVFADIGASRRLAYKINEVRGTANDPKQAVNPAALFALGIIDELSHAMVRAYRESLDPKVIPEAIGWFQAQVGEDAFRRMMLSFVEQFPGTDIHRGVTTPAEWLKGSTDRISHLEAGFEELMLLWMANANPAFLPFKELFDDSRLAKTTPYEKLGGELPKYFATRPVMGPEKKNLFDLLRAPALVSPDSLSGQIAYIEKHWGFALGEAIRRLLLASDLLKEEDLAIWMRFHPPSDATLEARRQPRGFTPGRGEVLTFSDSLLEYERFSRDVDWMPTTVMIAKSTYVWLAQLSKQYGREIRTLDQIPDEELGVLASRGINALWLIGVWERSRASKTIKQLMGNHDAVASAYSLADYQISWDLGGEAAYRNLRDRARAKGIRLASDMVPNHMGIDSKWVVEHPEWFLCRRDCPYPAYRFEGPDLSNDDRVEIKIEDHYFEQSDAAVVFRRRDKWTGDTMYVYHGNDGTSFPWNDTAQLNYLSAAVREQVIQTILCVARLFPIIRFDAAMTLAKRHVQRLWFPLPGTGGAIPSRAEYSMTKEEFDAAMPAEFWREVVDRVAAEVPGTLLLAEAFWMMEGYFVRTLGMHRVYNSAFMVMLRDEDNANYRSVLKNTLEFDPDIMKRYVNFMSNPDERTAIDQFGTGDKYFGVATMMATLPGLPMLGHGQVEGFTEKYGMEYQRPRYDETPNQGLVERHQREIAPLLHSRALFAESHDFLLYDFWRDNGTVDENVFAYSNRHGDQRALVLYHNRFATTRGTVHGSAAYADKGSGELRQRSLREGLALSSDPSAILAYRDLPVGLEYLKRSAELLANGFTIELHAYKYAVLLDWRELRSDEEHPWDELCDALQGRGVPNLDHALINLKLRPVHQALRSLLDPSLTGELARLGQSYVRLAGPEIGGVSAVQRSQEEKEFVEMLRSRAAALLTEVKNNRVWILWKKEALSRTKADNEPGAPRVETMPERVGRYATAAMYLPRLEDCFSSPWSVEVRRALPSQSASRNSLAIWGPVLAWCVIQALADSLNDEQSPHFAEEMFDTLHLREVLAASFASMDLDGDEGWRAAARVRLALCDGAPSSEAVLPESIWGDGDWRWLTGTHEASGHAYFRKEDFEQALWWLQLPSLIGLANKTPAKEDCRELERKVRAQERNAEIAGFDLHIFLHSGIAAAAPKKPADTPARAETISMPAGKNGSAAKAKAKGKRAPKSKKS